jgi:hypothetical protein
VSDEFHRVGLDLIQTQPLHESRCGTRDPTWEPNGHIFTKKNVNAVSLCYYVTTLVLTAAL